MTMDERSAKPQPPILGNQPRSIPADAATAGALANPSKVGSLLARLARINSERRELGLPASEQKALQKTREEAALYGAHIDNPEGGLPASLALGVFRRDEYRCKGCGGRQNLGLHHQGGEKSSRHAWKGKMNSPNNVVVLCKGCHDRTHTRDRARTGEDDGR